MTPRLLMEQTIDGRRGTGVCSQAWDLSVLKLHRSAAGLLYEGLSPLLLSCALLAHISETHFLFSPGVSTDKSVQTILFIPSHSVHGGLSLLLSDIRCCSVCA